MQNIFTYGSLMFDEVWQLLISADYKKSVGSLQGFTRKCVVYEEYPVIFRSDRADKVEGVLYYNVSSEDIRKLDSFEGNYYCREKVIINTYQNIAIEAYAYVLKDTFNHIATSENWSPEYFSATGISKFLKNYSGFSRQE